MRMPWMLCLILLLTLLACVPAAPNVSQTPSTVEPGAPAAQAAKPAPKRGGTLIYAGYNPNNNLHPYKPTNRPGVIGTLGPVYETLLANRFEPGFDYRIDYEVIPWLAESWEQPDANTYIFHLRKGVRWHDGQEFTAEDVVWSYEWARDPKNAFASVSGRLKEADRIEALDRYTLRITTKRPWGLFLQELAELTFYILPKHIFERGEDFAKVAVGTGPFKVGSHDPQNSTRLVRNENYWQPGKPYLDAMEVIWQLDLSARIAAFIARKNDLIGTETRAQFDPILKARPELEYSKTIMDVGFFYYMKVDKPPFSDVRVRRAVHLAVDRQSMVKTLTFGEGVINPPGVNGFKEGWAIPQEELMKLPGYRQPKDQDIAEAKRLMAEAGYANGFKTSVIYSATSIVKNLAEMMPGQLRAIGIDLELNGMEAAAHTRAREEGSFETQLYRGYNASLTADLPDHLHSKGPFNKMGINDPRLDELLDAIPSAMNVEARKKAARELQYYLLEKLYAIPTFEFAGYYAWHPWVRDFTKNPQYWAVIIGQEGVQTTWIDVEKLPADRR